MSKVIMFSRVFPAYHPKAGQPTFFVEKILKFLPEKEYENEQNLNYFRKITDLEIQQWIDLQPKYHTIRTGHRFKVGDKFSPRVWSGKPYRSKQIIIAPDIEVKKVWNFKITTESNSEMRYDISNFIYINGKLVMDNEYDRLSKNDGLSVQDFCDWFRIERDGDTGTLIREFDGQIICWNQNIEY